jgi:hypothetical protein
MGKRGPKAADAKFLQEDAVAWASLFYTIRDGQSGYMQKLKWGPVQNTGPAEWTPILSGRGRIMLPANTQYRTSEPLSPPIPVAVSEAAKLLPASMKSDEWFISRPVMPAPEIWELLKRARRVKEVQRASQRIRSWMTKQFGPGLGRWLPGTPPSEFADVLERVAENMLTGKNLPGYAKTDRPKSDDKRVEFLAKVLAGARFGLAPITAAKRLSHWHWPRDWAEKTFKEYLDLAKNEFVKLAEEKNRNVSGPVDVLKNVRLWNDESPE